MLDTNVFGDLIEENIDYELLNRFSGDIYITHLQKDELEDTANQELKNELLEIKSEILCKSALL
jgi:hypothetical protein